MSSRLPSEPLVDMSIAARGRTVGTDADDTSAARGRLNTALALDDPRRALSHLLDDRFFERWIPEVAEMRMEQDPIHRHKDVLAHTLAVTADTVPQLRLRMAALLHDVGKPATRRIGPDGVTFRHHEAVGARIAVERLGQMGYDPGFVADVARLVELSGRGKGYANGWTDRAVRRYARDAGALLGDLLLLVRCDCTTRNAGKVAAIQRDIDDLEQRIRRLAVDERAARQRPPLSGDQVMALLGIGPGPMVGSALEVLLDHHRHVEPIDERAAVEVLRRWWAQ